MSLCVSVVIVQCAMCGGVAVAPITCPTHSICIRDHIPIAYNNIYIIYIGNRIDPRIMRKPLQNARI